MERAFRAAHPRISVSLTLALASGLVGLLGGCSSSEKAQTVAMSPSDFVKPGPTPGPDRTEAVARRPGSLRVTAERSGPIAETDGILDVTSEIGVPTVDAADAVAESVATGPAFIDAKVGDINNKAVYASEFLEPMGARLRAEAAKLKPDAWRKFAAEQIRDELIRMRDDELFRAEALSELKPEQRQGLAAMMDNYVEEQRLRAGGSSEAMRRRLYDERGQTVEEAVKARENSELIGYQLQRKVVKPIQITRKDLDLAYEKNFDIYNPNPRAFFREILVDATKLAAIEEIRAQLAAGKPFAEVAARPDNDYRPSKGGQVDPIEIQEEFAKTQFFGLKELNDAAHALRPGQWTGPLSIKLNNGRSVAIFLFLEQIEEISTSFYDAQLSMESGLRDMATRRAKAKYLEGLLRRASYTPIPEMVDRLLAIATERYGPGAPKR